MIIHLGLIGIAVGVAAPTAAARCDRTCLLAMIDRYRDALLHHAPVTLRVAASAEIRENTARVEMGESDSWIKIVRFRARQSFADAATGNVVARDAVELEGGKIGSLSVRLKIVEGRIDESETSFNQGTGPFDAENMLEPDIVWDATIAPERRSSRREMTRITDDYFESISQHREVGNIFSKRCDRYESGKKMTNNSANLSNESGNVTCAGSLRDLKGQAVEQRRFPLVDVERGVVLGYGFIQHRERAKPQATGLAELFKIVDGKIRAIENIETVVSYPVEGGFRVHSVRDN